MKVIYCVIIMICPVVNMGQKAPLKPLATGDPFPAIVRVQAANYTAPEINLAAYKDQLVLLDFMTTGCISCIAALPRFDSLQKEFAGRLQIVLVTPEKKGQVASFLKRKNIAGLPFPVVWGDTLLQQLFPHTFIPHDVLIRNGKIISITYPEYIVAANIKAILAGRDMKLPVKRDITDFSYTEPLLHLNENTIPDFSYPANSVYSTVTSYMDDVPERFTTVEDTVRHIRRISMINVPVVDLYKRALYGPVLEPAFIELDVINKSRYEYCRGVHYTKEWLRDNCYCYEGSFPLSFTMDDTREKIKADLDFYLQLHGSVVNKMVPCFVLQRDTTVSNAAVTGTAVTAANETKEAMTVETMLHLLNSKYGAIPALDETGNKNLRLNHVSKAICQDIPALQQMLQQYGLSLKPTHRLLTILVITENRQNNFKRPN